MRQGLLDALYRKPRKKLGLVELVVASERDLLSHEMGVFCHVDN
jgi:hypothetical protein